MTIGPFEVLDLGRLAYRPACDEQARHVDRLLDARAAGLPPLGVLLLVEHPPVITLTPRARQGANLLAHPETLRLAGVELQETDRGGDITYHGPGQLVVYPIVDLQRLRLGLHEHMRTLESGVINGLAALGLRAGRDPKATGVWVDPARPRTADTDDAPPDPVAKICAMGVRVRKWVTMHGLALNVDPDMSHFGLIVPCGLAGRPVTSMRALLGEACPPMDAVKHTLARELVRAFNEKAPARAGA